MEEMKSMFKVYAVILVVGVISGVGLTVLIQPSILSMLPEGGYSPLISWVVSVVASYAVVSVLMAIVWAFAISSIVFD
jgi:hypothetical protein